MKKFHLQKGFTLIEMIVSIAVFTIALVIIVGALIMISNESRKARASRTVIDNMGTAIESMTRSIRTGRSFNCGCVGTLTTSNNCVLNSSLGSGGDVCLAFFPESAPKTSTAQSDMMVFRYNATDKSIERSTDGGAAYARLTAPEIQINKLNFFVNGATYGVNQPIITIVLQGIAGDKPNLKTDFNLETSVTPRIVNSGVSARTGSGNSGVVPPPVPPAPPPVPPPAPPPPVPPPPPPVPPPVPPPPPPPPLPPPPPPPPPPGPGTWDEPSCEPYIHGIQALNCPFQARPGRFIVNFQTGNGWWTAYGNFAWWNSGYYIVDNGWGWAGTFGGTYGFYESARMVWVPDPLPAGYYHVCAYSYDGSPWRASDVGETNEQWSIHFVGDTGGVYDGRPDAGKSGGSNAVTPDLQDGINESDWLGVIDPYVWVPNDVVRPIDSMKAWHYIWELNRGVHPVPDQANSVFPVCAAYDPV